MTKAAIEQAQMHADPRPIMLENAMRSIRDLVKEQDRAAYEQMRLYALNAGDVPPNPISQPDRFAMFMALALDALAGRVEFKPKRRGRKPKPKKAA